VAVGLSIAVLAGCAAGPKTGSQAPGFSALDSKGRSVSLADYHANTLVLYFWAVWCAPCATSGPEIQALHEEFKDEDVAVLGVHFDGSGDPHRYMIEHQYTFDLIPDGTSVAKAYGVNKIPQIVVVGGDGTVIHRQIGFAEGDGETIASLLTDRR
jgi:peroxiredoxin